jgi:hypothetical protein
MATTIQIKRSTAATAPTTTDLALAELAYSMDDSNNGASAKLYIESTEGGSAAIHAIGGKYYTDLVDAATDANTASAIVKRDGSGNFTAGTITADLSGTATSATALETARTINGVSFDGTANISFDTDSVSEGSTNQYFTNARARGAVGVADGSRLTYNSSTGEFDIAAEAGDIESVTAGSGLTGGGTAGDVTLNIGAGTGVTVNADDIAIGQDVATTANVTFASVTADLTGDVTGNADTATTLETARTIGGVSFDGSANINLPGVNAAGNQDTSGNAATATALETARSIALSGDATGSANFDGSANATISATLADSGVTAGSYGSTTAIPAITVDSKGRVTAVSTNSISTSFDLAADSGTTNEVAGGETLTIAGTANEVTTAVSGNTVTVGLPDDVTIAGNLTVNGTTTTVATTNLEVSDPLFSLASGNGAADSVDIGFYGLYDSTGSQDLYSGFFRDASDSGKWKLFKDSQTVPTTTVDTGATGYSVATLVANIEGNLTGNVTGTVSSLSNHDTDDVAEGSTNLYYTDARFNSAFDTRLAASTIDGGTY